jgi:hypothetical protein
MEMTVARDRWQQHLKSHGDHYAAAARELEELHARHPDAGAGVAALAHHALAALLEACRVGRLTRHQHVLLRLGALVALVEGSGALARRAVRAAEGRLGPKAASRFPAAALAAISRVNARDVALTVATEGSRWVIGAAEAAEGDAVAVSLGRPAIERAQAGLLDDLDAVAGAIYGGAA